MRVSGTGWLALFWAMQVAAALLFKYGTTGPGRYWLGFLGGNLFGASSIFVLMKLYSMMQVNVAGALAGGGAFLAAQFALMLAFHERLTWSQYLGILAVTAGMFLVTSGQDTPEPEAVGGAAPVAANAARAEISAGDPAGR